MPILKAPKTTRFLRRILQGGAFLFFLCLGSAPLAADFNSGLAAYKAGDFATAAQDWTIAAEAGVPAAMRNLAHLYRWGKGVPKNLLEAVKWYQKAAETGMESAMLNLAVLYQEGDENFPPDMASAALWYERAAMKGNARAKAILAQLLISGEGIAKNPERARQLLLEAAKGGVPEAAELLARMDAPTPAKTAAKPSPPPPSKKTPPLPKTAEPSTAMASAQPPKNPSSVRPTSQTVETVPLTPVAPAAAPKEATSQEEPIQKPTQAKPPPQKPSAAANPTTIVLKPVRSHSQADASPAPDRPRPGSESDSIILTPARPQADSSPDVSFPEANEGKANEGPSGKAPAAPNAKDSGSSASEGSAPALAFAPIRPPETVPDAAPTPKPQHAALVAPPPQTGGRQSEPQVMTPLAAATVMLHLGAYPDRRQAQSEWTKLEAKLPDLPGIQSKILSGFTPEHGDFVRLYLTGDRERLLEACRRIRQADPGTACELHRVYR